MSVVWELLICSRKIANLGALGLGSVGSGPSLKEKAGEESMWIWLSSLVAHYVWSFLLVCPENKRISLFKGIMESLCEDFRAS